MPRYVLHCFTQYMTVLCNDVDAKLLFLRSIAFLIGKGREESPERQGDSGGEGDISVLSWRVAVDVLLVMLVVYRSNGASPGHDRCGRSSRHPIQVTLLDLGRPGPSGGHPQPRWRPLALFRVFQAKLWDCGQ